MSTGGIVLPRAAFNNVTLLFNRNTNLTTVPYFANGPNIAAELGIQGTSPNPLNYGPPTLSFTNFSSLTDTNDSRQRGVELRVNDTLQVRRGKHNWSFGGGVTHFLNNSITDQNGRGPFSFSGLSRPPDIRTACRSADTGYDFADFLLGLPETSSIRYGDSSLYFRSNGYNAFAMDDYRIATNLSSEPRPPLRILHALAEEYGHISNLESRPNFSGVTPVCAVATAVVAGPPRLPAALIRGDSNNFGPRTAIAWKPWPKGKLLVRAGYGMVLQSQPVQQIRCKSWARSRRSPPVNSVTTSSAE